MTELLFVTEDCLMVQKIFHSARVFCILCFRILVVI